MWTANKNDLRPVIWGHILELFSRVFLSPLFFCLGTLGTLGTPHKQGLPVSPVTRRNWGHWGQNSGYPQRNLPYALILHNF